MSNSRHGIKGGEQEILRKWLRGTSVWPQPSLFPGIVVEDFDAAFLRLTGNDLKRLAKNARRATDGDGRLYYDFGEYMTDGNEIRKVDL